MFAQGEGGQEGGTLIGTETEHTDERAVLVVVGVEVPGVVNRASQMRGYSKSPADSHLVAGGANADAAVPVQPERRAPALPALVALAPVEVADQQQPPAHPRRQVRSAFADLCLEALEGYLERCHDLFCHATECAKHTFDLLTLRMASFRPERCLRSSETPRRPRSLTNQPTRPPSAPAQSGISYRELASGVHLARAAGNRC